MINADYIKKLMDDKNYTIGNLAIKSGISKSQLSRILRYKRGIGSKTLAGLIKAFPDADIKQIFFDDGVTHK